MSQTHLEDLSLLPRAINQPGPSGVPWVSVPTRLEKLDFELSTELSLADAISKEIESRSLAGAFIKITHAPVSTMQYVLPGLPHNDEHVAWFSETYSPPMPGHIENASVICGFKSGKPTFHCHGQFCDVEQIRSMGHLLLDSCYLSTPVRLTGFGFKGAQFNRRADPQTNFELLMPELLDNRESSDEGMLVRIAPNIDISSALIECCQKASWQRATVYGVGSLIGAHFDDGRILQSFATEYMVIDGTVDLSDAKPRIDLHIALVGLDGEVMQGRLTEMNNPVLITSELVLKNQLQAN